MEISGDFVIYLWSNKCRSRSQLCLPPKLFAMTFHSSARKTSSFCLISLLLIKVLFLSKQLTKTSLVTSNLQVSEKRRLYKKSPLSYCDLPSQRSRRIESPAPKTTWISGVSCTQRDMCSSYTEMQAQKQFSHSSCFIRGAQKEGQG